MKHNRVLTTAALCLLLGATLPAFAQKGEEEKGGGKSQPAQHQSQPQHQQQAQHQSQPQHQQQAQHQSQPQHQQQAQHTQQAQHPQRQSTVAYNNGNHGNGNNGYHGNGNNGNHYGRIDDDHYRAHFGNEHSFHMGHPQFYGGYNRFQYGGYSFGYNERWPEGWGYDDDVYVEFIDGNYYMVNPRHPGFHLTLNIF